MLNDYTGLFISSRHPDGSIKMVRVRFADQSEGDVEAGAYFVQSAQPPLHVLRDCSKSE